MLRIDNGRKFCGKAFNQFCRQHGIAQQNTTPYMPQHNIFAERMNIMLMEKARSMLTCAGITQEFWVEAIDTDVTW